LLKGDALFRGLPGEAGLQCVTGIFLAAEYHSVAVFIHAGDRTGIGLEPSGDHQANVVFAGLRVVVEGFFRIALGAVAEEPQPAGLVARAGGGVVEGDALFRSLPGEAGLQFAAGGLGKQWQCSEQAEEDAATTHG
jgi:hypothetical protein